MGQNTKYGQGKAKMNDVVVYINTWCYEVTDLPMMYPTCFPVTAGMDWDCTILQDL